MVINVFGRPDGTLVIVPALFQPPMVLEREGALRLLGQADVELSALSDSLVEQLGLSGYAVAGNADAPIIRAAVVALDASPSAPGEEAII